MGRLVAEADSAGLTGLRAPAPTGTGSHADQIHLSADHHDQLVHSFEAAHKELTATIPSPELWRYLGGLHAWLGGNHEWHATTGRYTTSA
ncbi:hypothetical protein ACFWAT_01845 [Streptomyces syringium]|uniref:hypothetical protein n=1 Tax=Streptomyces syringium TaxID=76729 RepID=UPI003654383A